MANTVYQILIMTSFHYYPPRTWNAKINTSGSLSICRSGLMRISVGNRTPAHPSIYLSNMSYHSSAHAPAHTATKSWKWAILKEKAALLSWGFEHKRRLEIWQRWQVLFVESEVVKLGRILPKKSSFGKQFLFTSQHQTGTHPCWSLLHGLCVHMITSVLRQMTRMVDIPVTHPLSLTVSLSHPHTHQCT